MSYPLNEVRCRNNLVRLLDLGRLVKFVKYLTLQSY